MTETGISSSGLPAEITLMTNAIEIITDSRDVTRVLVEESPSLRQLQPTNG